MSLKTPTIVILDMDGTAVRHINPWVLPVLERLDDAYYMCAKFFGWFFRRRAKDPLLPPPEHIPPRRKPRLLVHRALHKVRRKEVDQIVEPCPGIYDVLDLLRAHDIPMAMISNGLGKGYGHDIMTKFDLEDYFGATVFREEVHKSKPSPEALLLALKRMNITPGEDDVIWYIGDRHKDVVAAQMLTDHIPGKTEPIAYGVNAAVAIVEKGFSPENIIMSYYDMEARLEKMLGKAPEPTPKSKKKAPPEKSGELAA